jgi:hypothetical protein
MADQWLIDRPTLGEALLPYLAKDVAVSVMYDDSGNDGFEGIYLKLPDGRFLAIVAEGDEGGYFDWEVSDEEKAFPRLDDLGPNVVRLADYR